MFNISTKSIRRWEKNGIEKKKGTGRKKLEPLMENELLKWMESQKGTEITASQITNKAKALCKHKDFKASKGWLKNFIAQENIKAVRRGRIKVFHYIDSSQQSV